MDSVEQNEIDNAFIFLSHFTNTPFKIFYDEHEFPDNITFVSDYREYIIKIMSKLYKIDDFYKYERIVQILFWFLKKKLKPFIDDNKTQYIKEDSICLYNNKGIYSYKNAYYQYNQKKNIYYLLENPSELDNICAYIMTNKKLYYKYIENPEEIKKFDKNKLKKSYYFFNYPFPNVNPMFYNNNNKKIWIKKIKKMYYEIHPEKQDKYWYNIINVYNIK
jgi:hypothetical protein